MRGGEADRNSLVIHFGGLKGATNAAREQLPDRLRELQSLALRSVGEADEWKNYRQRKSFTATARRGWRSRLGWLSGLEAARKRLMLAALASWHDCKLAFLPLPSLRPALASHWR